MSDNKNRRDPSCLKAGIRCFYTRCVHGRDCCGRVPVPELRDTAALRRCDACDTPQVVIWDSATNCHWVWPSEPEGLV